MLVGGGIASVAAGFVFRRFLVGALYGVPLFVLAAFVTAPKRDSDETRLIRRLHPSLVSACFAVAGVAALVYGLLSGRFEVGFFVGSPLVLLSAVALSSTRAVAVSGTTKGRAVYTVSVVLACAGFAVVVYGWYVSRYLLVAVGLPLVLVSAAGYAGVERR